MSDLVIYDGDCAFCSSAARFGKARIAPDLEFQPYQRLELTQYGLTVELAAAALQYVTGDGKIYSGHRAVNQILIHAGYPLKLIGLMFSLPGLSKIAAISYKLIANNRHRLPGGTPTCKFD